MMTKRLTTMPSLGLAQTRLLEQMAKALDPLAALYGGTPPLKIKPLIEQAWCETFGTDLQEPALSRCAAAISARRPWLLALWNNDGPDV
jgi:hypothetical protein